MRAGAPDNGNNEGPGNGGEHGSHFIGNEYSLFVTAYLVHFLAFPELSDKASLLCVTNPPNIRHVA